ncbi:rCG47423 [Rattus norvegicus]|uniref:RCG47423 n=1 Tax=Rattus norvegicus TaxID=10116 RepID=A6I0Q4_RAT|nr:rCG47423 [Rattus norvegicus]
MYPQCSSAGPALRSPAAALAGHSHQVSPPRPRAGRSGR